MAIKEALLSLWSSETAEARTARHRDALTRRGPRPSDKYLPIWVIGSMSVSVAVLLLTMTFVCSVQRCKAPAPAAPAAQTSADQAAKAAEAAVAAAKAAAVAASR